MVHTQGASVLSFLKHPLVANMQFGPGIHIAPDPGPEAAVSHRDMQ
jgi:hypothetical protein